MKAILEKSLVSPVTIHEAPKGSLAVTQSPNGALSLSEDVVIRKDPIHELYDQLDAQNREIVAGLIRQLAEKEGIQVSGDINALAYPAQGLDLWQSSLELSGMSLETIKSYRHKVERLLAKYPTPTNLAIRNFLAAMLHEDINEHDVDSIEARKGTISNYIKAIRSFFKYLYVNRLWASDPSNGIKIPKLARREKVCPPEEDVRRLLSELAGNRLSWKDKSMLVLLVETGVRVTELASIRMSNVHFDKLEIVVFGKGHKERAVPISRFTAGVLFEYMKTLGKSEEFLFPTKRSHSKSGHFGRRAVERWLERLCAELGVKHMSPHQLRHFIATYLLEHGADIKAVSQLLGHADVTITLQIYHHVGRKQVRQTQEQLGIFSKEPLMITNGKS